MWVADVLAAYVARRTDFAADARAVDFGYGDDLLTAYDRLGASEVEDKKRLQRLTDFQPPMVDRIGAVQARMATAAG